MSLEDFITKLKEEVHRLVDRNSRVEIRQIQKNNVGVLPALSIIEMGMSVSINFYLKSLYKEFEEKGKTVEEIAKQLVQTHYENITKCQDLDIRERFENPNKVRELLFFRLINFGQNRQLLEKVPHVKILDLALVYYLMIDRDEEKIGSMRTSYEMFRHFGWDTEEMCQEVLANTVKLFPKKVTPLSQLLRRICGVVEEEPEDSFEDVLRGLARDGLPLVLTNTGGINGATALAYPDLLREIAEEIGFNLFLLPSSIHEFMVLPDNGDYPLEELEQMLVAVNRSSVEPEEMLSDHVYYYDADSDRLAIADGKAIETDKDS